MMQSQSYDDFYCSTNIFFINVFSYSFCFSLVFLPFPSPCVICCLLIIVTLVKLGQSMKHWCRRDCDADRTLPQQLLSLSLSVSLTRTHTQTHCTFSLSCAISGPLGLSWGDSKCHTETSVSIVPQTFSLTFSFLLHFCFFYFSVLLQCNV